MTDPVALPAPGWLRTDVVVRALLSVLAAAAVLAFDVNLPLLLLAAFALAALYPRQAVLVWIGLAGTLIIPLYQYRTASVYFSAAYLALLLLGMTSDLVLRRPRTWRPPRALTIAMLALGLAAIASGLHGALDYDPTVPGVHRFALVQVYASALLVLSVGAALLVAYRLDDARTALLIVIGVGVWCSLVPILQSPSIPAAGWNTMIMAQAMAPCTRLLRCPPRSFPLRGLGTAFILYGVFSDLGVPLLSTGHGQWVSSWLAIGVGLGIITWVHFAKLRWRVLVPGAVAALLAISAYIARAVTRAQQEGDFGRVKIWEDALRLLSMRPLLGVGPGNYSDYIERYALGHPYGSAHGNYQQIAAETGLLGIFAFLCVIGAALHLAWRQQRSSDPFISAFALGVLGAMSGQLGAAVVGDYLLPAYHNGGHTNVCVTLYFWILLGALMATATHPEGAAPPSTT
jgi:O-antigen ligase